MRHVLSSSMLLAFGLMACSGAPEGSTDNAAVAAAPKAAITGNTVAYEQTFTRTIVTIKEDGTRSVSEGLITRTQQLQEIETRDAYRAAKARGELSVESLYHDTGCALADFWAWDQTGYVGNEICFYNLGSTPDNADLATYVRTTYRCGTGTCRTYWYDVVHGTGNYIASYEMGQQEGCFNNSSTTTNVSSYWNFYTGYNDLVSNTGSDITSFEYLWLSGICSYAQ